MKQETLSQVAQYSFHGERRQGVRGRQTCPYADCSLRRVSILSPALLLIVRKGYFFRSSDSKKISRYHCRNCLRSFSSASFSPCFLQKKRTLNPSVQRLLCSSVSQRRAALILRVNPKTIVRKFLFLSVQARLKERWKWEAVRLSKVNHPTAPH